MTGELQPFQAGVGFLAMKLKVPILPVYIEGTYQSLPKGKRIPRKQKIRVRFGTCIELTDYQSRLESQTEPEIYAAIAQAIEQEVQRLRNR